MHSTLPVWTLKQVYFLCLRFPIGHIELFDGGLYASHSIDMGKPSSRGVASHKKSSAAHPHKGARAGPKGNKGSLKPVHQKHKAVAGAFVRSCGISAAGLNSLLQGAFEDLAEANIKVQSGAPKTKRVPCRVAHSGEGSLMQSDLLQQPLSLGQPPMAHEPADLNHHQKREAQQIQPNLSSLMDGFNL